MYRIGQEEIDAVARAINSHDFFKINRSGQEVLHFEEEWKQHIGASYALTMTSGFGAIVSALVGLGIGPGDEVIVPAYTYIATALAVTAVGAIPVIAESDESLTIDPTDVEKKISSHTKAIIPVHIQGFPSKMDALCALAKPRGIAIVEDACQADGGSFHGKALGAIGDAGAFSFNYFKIMTAGEGGAMVTSRRDIYERALIYHDSCAVAFFGSQLDGISEPLFGGTEFRISDITGAILREQLKRLPGLLKDLRARRRAVIDAVRLDAIPSNDDEGDCGTTAAFRFGSAEEARAVQARCKEKGIYLVVPIDTGKHIYTNWTQIMEKRGSWHPLLDPFKMEANRGLQHDYTMDMCPKTLDYLSRTAYLMINPDWDDAALENVISVLNS